MRDAGGTGGKDRTVEGGETGERCGSIAIAFGAPYANSLKSSAKCSGEKRLPAQKPLRRHLATRTSPVPLSRARAPSPAEATDESRLGIGFELECFADTASADDPEIKLIGEAT